MASFINASNHLLFSSHSIDTHPPPPPSSSTFPSLPFLIQPTRQQHQPFRFHLLVSKRLASLGSPLLFFHNTCRCSGSAKRRRRKGGLEGEGDSALEDDILEFMEKSNNPNVFPNKKVLIEAGRMDLVERIVKQGGWLSYGWDSNEELEPVQQHTIDDHDRIFQQRFISDAASWVDVGIGTSEVSSSLPSSSGREDEEDAGIQGILTRIQKERIQSFGLGLSRDKYNNGDYDESYLETTEDFGTMNSFKVDGWRKFSYQRAHASGTKLGEHIAGEDEMGASATETEIVRTELNSSNKMKDPNQIRSRIQGLELELAAALRKLRSRTNLAISDKDKSTSEESHMLSDAWEFQETEIINSRDKLRSLRAQLAILEGKMALTIVDMRKKVEAKQKKIHDATRAISQLRTAIIVWPNSASEVLLVGSFDGWTNQRKMERSSAGIFSLYLKLYPGRYEFKFIVDGSWMIDPLRPTVRSGCYENNVLIVY